MAEDLQLRLTINADAAGATEALEQVGAGVEGVGAGAEGANEGLKTFTNTLFSLDLIQNIVSALAEKMGDLADMADEWANLQAQVALVTQEQGDLAAVMERVRAIADGTSTDLAATAGLYSTLTRALTSLGDTQTDVSALTETINQSFAVSGASAAETAGTITQLAQALASGQLRGDEFNSVMEQSPRLTQALADSLGVTTGELRAMAESGQLTAQTVIGALTDQSAAIQAEFDALPDTIGRATTRLRNSVLALVGDLDETTGASERVGQASELAAKGIDLIANNIEAVAVVIGAAGLPLLAVQATAAATAVRGLAVSLATSATSGVAAATAMTALQKPLAAVAAAASAMVGYQVGSWLRETAESAEGSHNAMALLNGAFKAHDALLKALSPTYAAQVAAEEQMAAAHARETAMLKAVAEQTGYTFKSFSALMGAVDKGAVVWDAASQTWARGAVSLQTAEAAVTKLDAALQTQAERLQTLAGLTAAGMDIERQRAELSAQAAQAAGDETAALTATVEARAKQTTATQMALGFARQDLALAERRVAAMQDEVKQGGTLTAAKQAEVAELQALVTEKRLAVQQAELAVAASQQEQAQAERALASHRSVATALQAQASAIEALAEREDQEQQIAAGRRELAIDLAKAMGDEATAVRLTAEAREADADAAERAMEVSQAALDNAQARLDALIVEAEQSGKVSGAQQAEIATLTALVEEKRLAIEQSQLAADAAGAEAVKAQLAADTYGDQSSQLVALKVEYANARAEVQHLAAMQEKAAIASRELVDAERDLADTKARMAQAMTTAAERGEDLANVTKAYAEELSTAQSRVDELSGRVEAGAGIDARATDAKEALALAQARLADALKDEVANREAALTAAERTTSAIEREGDLRVTQLGHLADEERARADIAKTLGDEEGARAHTTKATELGIAALEAEASTLEQTAAAKQEELVAAQAVLEAKLAEADADGVRTQAELEAIAVAEEAVASKQSEVDAANEAAEAKTQEAESARDLSEAEKEAAAAKEEAAEAAEDAAFAAREYSITLEETMERAGASTLALGEYFDVAKAKYLEMYEALADGQTVWFGKAQLESLREIERTATDAANAAAYLAKQADDLGESLDDLTDQYDAGELGLSEYIASLERLKGAYADLPDEELEDLTDALADAKEEQQDLTDTALDGLADWKAKLAEIYGQEVKIQQLAYEEDRLEAELELQEARRNGNAEEIAALEQKIALIDEYYAAKIEEAAQQEAEDALDAAEEAADEASRRAGLSDEERAYEDTLASLKAQLAAAIKSGDSVLKQSILDQIAAEEARHQAVMDNLEAEQEAKDASTSDSSTTTSKASGSGSSGSGSTTGATATSANQGTTSAGVTYVTNINIEGTLDVNDRTTLDTLARKIKPYLTDLERKGA